MIGLLDSLTGLILIYLGGQIPFNAWLVKGYFDTIPKELDEAAKIDGAGPIRIFLECSSSAGKTYSGSSCSI